MRDVAALMRWSTREFGFRAAMRYDALLKQALKDIAADPDLPGSKDRPELMIQGARTYHLEQSQDLVPDEPVKAPRHFLLYRRVDANVIEVARIIHDSRDFERHVPAAYRRK